MTETLFETAIYRLDFTTDFDVQNNEDGPYRVVNKKSGYREHASFVYPSCLERFYRLNSHVEKLEEAIRQGDETPDETATRLTDVKETSEVHSILERIRQNPPKVDLNAYRVLDDNKEDSD